MNISAGSRVGPYEIVAPLGAGGMGEVWRGRDTRLDRSVAIKILPADLAGNAQLRLRLEREARAISQLNHPNICTLYDVGHHDGTDYLVMEMLEEETLADRLARGPLPLTEVLRFATQIADALAAAHRQGVVHRDLKPGNVMITRAGAKLLDFGLAKNAPHADAADALTQRDPITEQGVVIGTVQYMAPEQLDGRPVDTRTDLFALGAVIYEMVTGRRAFAGTNRTSIAVAIMTTEPPPMTELQPVAPPALDHLVRSCMAKEPDERMQSAHDVALQLRAIAAAAPAPEAKRIRSSKAGWAVAAVLAAAMIAGVAFYIRTRPEPPPPVRFAIAPPPQTVFRLDMSAVSPDGRRIVFQASPVDGAGALWMRSVEAVESRLLPGTEEAWFAFWSPDGRHLGFFARGAMRRLDTVDGKTRTILERVDNNGGATWNRDDVIVFNRVFEGPLYRVPAEGGEPVQLTTLRPGEKTHCWPSFLPDGRHFVFSVGGSGGVTGIYVSSLDSPGHRKIVSLRRISDVTRTFFAAGHLFYLRNRSLVAHPFDLDTLEVRGEPVVVDDDILNVDPGNAPISGSPGGTIVYRKSGAPIVSELTFVDRTGSELRRVGEAAPYIGARLSPDGRRILVTREESGTTLWLLDVERGTSTRTAFEDSSFGAVWLPDGKGFAYSAVSELPPNIYLSRGQAPQPLTNNDSFNLMQSFSPDGRLAVFTMRGAQTGYDLYAVPTTPPHTPFAILATPFVEQSGEVSPDGRWIAYVSNQDGPVRAYVTTFPRAGPRWQISTGAAAEPRWSRDGSELYWHDPAQKQLMAAKIDVVDGEIRASIPRSLFAMTSKVYDVAPKGFVVAKRAANPNAPPLTVILNWRP